ncbi:hypothetical protein Pint_07527 [Pistacia integerrima]|uniref:Uncharacterized protein n=1 Tax=Pistacia integerrima TaxID=434235 RepID=A0ACC0XUL3_9ROSI|nr:hypothetical protein Pint_07527 [Pistacia integerrima]
MFDAYNNHINKGLEVELNLDGFRFEDQLGIKRKVDNYRCVDLSGLLKVIAGYGKSVFGVVDSKGDVDATIHNNEKGGQSHTLMIKSKSIGTEDSIRYAFRHGRYTVPAIPLPQCEGCFCFVAVHSRYTELHLSIKITTNFMLVPLLQSPKTESSEIPSYSDGKLLLLEGSTPLKHVGNLAVSIIKTEKEPENEICKYRSRIKNHEMALKIVDDQTAEVEQVFSQLQASTEPHILTDPYSLLTKEEITRRIESRGQSVAAVLCCVGKEFPLQELRTDFIEDIVSLVALIGRAWTSKLSRSFRAACALEEYEKNGEVNYTHGKAAERGELDGSDPQRRLALPETILPCGDTPPGFMGYAVNMVDLDEHYVYTRTDAGDGLRETLFYRLFGELQVYRTREDMIEARACIKHGAISLDGGILKENGLICLGRWNPTICFPVVGQVDMLPSLESIEKLNQIEEKKLKLGKLMCLKEKHNTTHEKALKKFNKKKEKYKERKFEISPKLRDYYLEYGNPEEE